jgi:hypothetical protein
MHKSVLQSFGVGVNLAREAWERVRLHVKTSALFACSITNLNHGPDCAACRYRPARISVLRSSIVLAMGPISLVRELAICQTLPDRLLWCSIE